MGGWWTTFDLTNIQLIPGVTHVGVQKTDLSVCVCMTHHASFSVCEICIVCEFHMCACVCVFLPAQSVFAAAVISSLFLQ